MEVLGGCTGFLRLSVVEVYTLKFVVVGNTQIDCARVRLAMICNLHADQSC